MANDIFSKLMGGNSTSNTNNTTTDIMSMILNKYGNMGNAINSLNSLINSKGLSARQVAINNLRGKHFSNETINEFRNFAKNSGLSDKEIDDALRSLGVIK